MYGLVAIPFPDYIQMSTRASRFNHDFRQVYTSRDYYKYSFSPLAIVQWNVLPESAVCKPYFKGVKFREWTTNRMGIGKNEMVITCSRVNLPVYMKRVCSIRVTQAGRSKYVGNATATNPFISSPEPRYENTPIQIF